MHTHPQLRAAPGCSPMDGPRLGAKEDELPGGMHGLESANKVLLLRPDGKGDRENEAVGVLCKRNAGCQLTLRRSAGTVGRRGVRV